MTDEIVRFLAAMVYAGWRLVKDGDTVVWQLGAGGRLEQLGSAWAFWRETGTTPIPF